MNKYPIQILVVDDEIGVRRSLVGKLKGFDLPIKIAGEAESAEEAYEIMRKEVLDLLLLDMRMPGMGGKRFLSLLKEEFPQVKVIVLSGYSDFEYVQQSLRNGAIDYLLKPIIKEELEHSLQKGLRAIWAEWEERNREKVKSSLLNQALPLLKHQLLNRLLRPASVESALEKLCHLEINLNFPTNVIAVARVVENSQSQKDGSPDVLQEFFLFEETIQEMFKNGPSIVCFPHAARRYEFIVLAGLPGYQGTEELEDLKVRFTKVIDHIKRFTNMELEMIFSQPFSSLENTCLALDEIMHRFDQRNEGMTDSKVDSLETFSVSQEELSSLITYIEQKNVRGIRKWMNQIWESSGDGQGKNKATGIFIAIEKAVDSLFIDREPFSDSIHRLYTKIEHEGSEDKLLEEFITFCIHLSDLAGKRNHTEARHMIRQAQKYIDENYFENMNLETLSQKFYLNRTYFSELFKKETGWNFKKYLNHIRVEKAKQFLKEQDFKPSVIAELVGISDPIYFTVMFKKATGFPPGEYRRRHA